MNLSIATVKKQQKWQKWTSNKNSYYYCRMWAFRLFGMPHFSWTNKCNETSLDFHCSFLYYIFSFRHTRDLSRKFKRFSKRKIATVKYVCAVLRVRKRETCANEAAKNGCGTREMRARDYCGVVYLNLFAVNVSSSAEVMTVYSNLFILSFVMHTNCSLLIDAYVFPPHLNWVSFS